MEIDKDILNTHIKAAIQGEQAAYKFVLDQYWNFVFGFLLKHINNEYEAEEITIETFSKAFDKLSQYNSQYEFSTWLISISKNLQIDKYRKQKNKPLKKTTPVDTQFLHNIADQSLTTEDQLIKEQNLAQLLRFIKMLKPHYQEVINLFYFQELSYKEISLNINEPLSNVKVRLLRARKLLAEIITRLS